MKLALISAALVAQFAANVANASCECTCVQGQVRALCTSSTDARPVCGPQVCPVMPPSVTPVLEPRVPPVGTSNCQQQQVLNNSTRQYEWKQVCR